MKNNENKNKAHEKTNATKNCKGCSSKNKTNNENKD